MVLEQDLSYVAPLFFNMFGYVKTVPGDLESNKRMKEFTAQSAVYTTYYNYIAAVWSLYRRATLYWKLRFVNDECKR